MNQLPGTLQPQKSLWSPLMFWNGNTKSLLVGEKSASDDAPDGWLPEIQLVLIFWHVLVFKKTTMKMHLTLQKLLDGS